MTDHDAHTWVEVWFDGYGWLPFDPTPSAGGWGSDSRARRLRPPRGARVRGFRRLGPPASTVSADPLQFAHRTASRRLLRRRAAGGRRHLRAVITGARQRASLLLACSLLAVRRPGIVVAKFAVRRARYLTRDPRRIAAACRQELADYLVDQHIDAARSATLHELGALVRHELAVEPDGFVAAATAARFGRPAGRERGAGGSARAASAHACHARPHPRARPYARDRLSALVRARALMHAVVMAAGEGTRLRPLTERWPKPVLPIDGRPVIATLLRELAAAGCTHAVVVTGHLAEQVEELVGGGAGFGIEIAFARQPGVLGSADTVAARSPPAPGRRFS